MNEEQIGIVGWTVGIILALYALLTVVDTTAFEMSKIRQSLATDPDGCDGQCSSCLFEAEENAAIYASAAPAGPPEEFWTDPDAWDKEFIHPSDFINSDGSVWENGVRTATVLSWKNGEGWQPVVGAPTRWDYAVTAPRLIEPEELWDDFDDGEIGMADAGTL